MAAMKDRKGRFRKCSEIVAKIMKGKTHTLLEVRESREAIHDPNSDLRLCGIRIVELDVAAKHVEALCSSQTAPKKPSLG